MSYSINKGSQLIHGYCFEVEFKLNGSYVNISFLSVSQIQDAVECETIVEGNGHIHLVPKYISSPQTVTFSKGISSISNDFIIKDLYVGRCIDEISVTIGNSNYDESRRKYLIKNCVITKCSISNIDALRSELLVETFEISYAEKINIQSK